MYWQGFQEVSSERARLLLDQLNSETETENDSRDPTVPFQVPAVYDHTEINVKFVEKVSLTK